MIVVHRSAEEPHYRSRVLRPWQSAALVGVGGLALGALTLLGQRWLPGNWNHLVNSGAVWLLFAFFAGSLMRSDGRAALAGFGILVGALVGYYAARQLAYGFAPTLHMTAFWGVTAIVGGPILGAAGAWWRDERRLKRVGALAVLGGVFVAEGFDLLRNVPQMHVAGWVSIGFGIVLPLFLGRSPRDRLYGLAGLVPVALLGFAFYELAQFAYLRL